MAHAHHHHHRVPSGGQAEPGFSLLRLSAAQRAVGAFVLAVLLWAAVLWASA